MGVRNLRRAGVLAVVVMIATVTAGCVEPSGGTVISTGVTYSGQYSVISPAVYFFDGKAGDRLTLEATSPDGFGATVASVVTVTGPGGAALAAIRTWSWSVTVELPTTGRYRIELRFPRTDTQPHIYWLRAGLDEHRGPLTLGLLETPPVVSGQALTWSYEGLAGEVLNTYRATVLDGSGAAVPDNGIDGRVTLPADGSYSVQVVQPGAAVTKDIDGGPVGLGHTVTPPLIANQGVRLVHPGTAGEVLGTWSGTFYDVVAPDGSTLQSRTLAAQRLVLPLDGPYTITVRSYRAVDPGPASEELWLSHDELAGPIAAGETVLPADRVPGQSVVYDYAGTAGERVQVHTVRLLPYPTCPFQDQPGSFPYATHSLVAPDGTSLSCTVQDDGTETWTTFELPVDGTYRLVVTPKSPSYDGRVGVRPEPAP